MKLPKSKGKIILILILNFVAFFALYFLGVTFAPLATMIIYTAILAVTSFGYVIYNRGFSRKNVTLDMLPDEWPPEKKTEFIEDGKQRLENSKWVLTVLIPLIGICAYELIDIYLMPYFQKWLG